MSGDDHRTMQHIKEKDDQSSSSSSSDDTDMSDEDIPRHASQVTVSPPKKKKSKKSQPGRYSQLVIDTIRRLGERNGSSLAKVYNEAKKVPWFDQQNGRTYLRYSIRALVQNDTLLQVKGTGANGSFRLNRRKLEEGNAEPSAPKPESAVTSKKSHKKKSAAGDEPKKSHKKQVDGDSPNKKSHKKKASSKEEATKLSPLKAPKAKKA